MALKLCAICNEYVVNPCVEKIEIDRDLGDDEEVDDDEVIIIRTPFLPWSPEPLRFMGTSR